MLCAFVGDVSPLFRNTFSGINNSICHYTTKRTTVQDMESDVILIGFALIRIYEFNGFNYIIEFDDFLGHNITIVIIMYVRYLFIPPRVSRICFNSIFRDAIDWCPPSVFFYSLRIQQKCI